jgi:hypothetical protein
LTAIIGATLLRKKSLVWPLVDAIVVRQSIAPQPGGDRVCAGQRKLPPATRRSIGDDSRRPASRSMPRRPGSTVLYHAALADGRLPRTFQLIQRIEQLAPSFVSFLPRKMRLQHFSCPHTLLVRAPESLDRRNKLLEQIKAVEAE